MPLTLTPELRAAIDARIQYHQVKFGQLNTGSFHRGAIEALRWVIARNARAEAGDINHSATENKR